MRATLLWLILILIAVTIFALSNTGTVTVMFWQWPLYTGSLALAVVGAGVLGALLTFFSGLPRHARLGGRVRDLERRLRAHEASAPPPPPTAPAAAHPSPGPEDTRRLP